MSGPLSCSWVTAAQRARLENWLNRLEPEPQIQAIPRRPAGETIPLSFAQERLWFLAQYERNSPLYNVPVAVRLSGALDVAALQRALDAILARHEILRTRYVADGGTPAQVIDDPKPVLLERIDFSGLPEPGKEAALRDALEREARRPFALARDPVLRTCLFRIGPERHVLLIVKHHIATDGWSENLFLRELSALYGEYAGGSPAGLPPLAAQYADYAAWQREALRGPAFERQLAYWRAKLAGVPPVLELPTERPRPARLSSRGGCRRVPLPPALIKGMHTLAQREGATLFMALCAGFQAFLHRYAGAADLVVGTPVAGRSRSETEPMVGFFVNTLPLRAEFSGPMNFAQVVRQAKETILGALANQDVPFERIVEEVRPPRSSSHLPLVQVMFIFQGAAFRLPQPAVLTFAPEILDTGTAKFDLTLVIEESDEGWAASAEYASDLFSPAAVDRLLSMYRTLLEGALADPAAPLSDLPLLDAEESRRISVEWNRTETPFGRDRRLPEVLSDQAERTPEETALIWRYQRVSYREWHARADGIASRLRARGVGPGWLVGVCLERSLAMMVGLLGILRTGAAYVPLDPTYPRERLRFMLEDSRAEVLLTEPRLAGLFGPDLKLVPIQLDEEGRVLGDVAEAPETAAMAKPPSPEDPAYVIYTSGSTGKPKGVVISHRNVLNFFAGIDRVLDGGRGVWLAMASICFDISVLELWWSLARGFTVVIASDSEKRSEAIARQIRTHGVTHLQCTPSLARMLFDMPAVRKSLGPVKKLLIGGEVLPAGLARELAGAIGGELYNVYGPTETTVWATAHRVAFEQGGADAAVPIGRPLANVRVYILDRRLRPVPVGVPGEIHIGGEGVSPGYLNRSELTAERFVPDPFRPGERLYRTGDLGRFREDGVVEFLGRVDFQVKLRGHRIELEEIEAALREHPSVHGCAVILRQEAGDPRLAAYVVPKPGAGGTSEEWRRHLKAKLPQYMVPAVFVVLPGLPLTPSGKIDRQALPAMDPSPVPVEKPAQREPATDLEARIARVWRSVVGQTAGLEDNFFACGGHSLMAVRLAVRLEEALGTRVPVSTIYEAPSIEELARRLQAGSLDGAGPELAAIQPRGDKLPFFLVHGIGSGMLWGYANLAAHLGLEQPLYAFKSRALDGGEEFATLEEMAAHYVEALLRFQPDGAYAIGGYCFGGNVAFEMACQLAAKGREVRLLALFNAYPQNGEFARMRWTPGALGAFLKNLAMLAGEFGRGEVGDRKRYLRWKLRRLRQKLGRSGEVRPDGRVNPDKYVDMGSFPENLWPLLTAHAQALRRYRQKVYPGPLTLFRTRGYPLFCSFDPAYGWGRYAEGGVTVRIVPGKHDTMLEEPHVDHLARDLAPLL